jgi:hypothetical protein
MTATSSDPPPSRREWLTSALLFGVTYPLIGVIFALPAHGAATKPWRWAAWLASAAVFAAHLWYEHSRRRSSPARAAARVAAAVALGAFLLAAWINVHGWWVDPGHVRPMALLALMAFPLGTGLPAFVAALLALAAAARWRR